MLLISENDIYIDTINNKNCDLKIESKSIEKFNSNNLYLKYKVRISDKLADSIKKTVKHAIDTEMLIRYILFRLNEDE